MSPASFSIHPDAIDEALSAARWYRERSTITAKRFVAELNKVIDNILEAPHRWRHLGARHTQTEAPMLSVFSDLPRRGR